MQQKQPDNQTGNISVFHLAQQQVKLLLILGNISVSDKWVDKTFCTDVDGAQGMKTAELVDPLSFSSRAILRCTSVLAEIALLPPNGLL